MPIYNFWLCIFIKVLLNNLKKSSGKLRLLKTSRMRASSSTCAECELMAGTMFEDSGGVVWGCIGVDVVSLLFSLFFGYKIDKIQIIYNITCLATYVAHGALRLLSPWVHCELRLHLESYIGCTMDGSCWFWFSACRCSCGSPKQPRRRI